MEPTESESFHQAVEKPRQPGLRIWQLMVLIAVVGILLGLFVPAIFAAREAAQRSQCVNNLKQIGMALHNYQSANGCLPPATTTDSRGRPMQSWRMLILPYLEDSPLPGVYRFDESWDGPNNRKLLQPNPIFVCPSDPRGYQTGRTNYMLLTGPGTAFPGPNQSLSLTEMLGKNTGDKPAPLILVVETTSYNTHWMQPGDIDVRDLARSGTIEAVPVCRACTPAWSMC